MRGKGGEEICFKVESWFCGILCIADGLDERAVRVKLLIVATYTRFTNSLMTDSNLLPLSSLVGSQASERISANTSFSQAWTSGCFRGNQGGFSDPVGIGIGYLG